MATQTPLPPLPFGSEAGLADVLVTKNITVSDLKSITSTTNLVGQRVYDTLSTRDQLGYTSAEKGVEGWKEVDFTRQPFVLTCQSWLQTGRYIVWRCNPGEVQWRMPQRSALQKTRIGEIMHIWRDRFRNTFYDEPVLTITFQSGNIMPIRQKAFVPDPAKRRTVVDVSQVPGTGEEETRTIRESRVVRTLLGKKDDPTETPQIPSGLSNFYEFLALVDEQKILTGKGETFGQVNYCYMIYNSRVFPNITLMGLFTPEGTSWTDSSQDPNQVSSWTANFTVYDSYPRLNQFQTLRNFFESAGFGRV